MCPSVPSGWMRKIAPPLSGVTSSTIHSSFEPTEEAGLAGGTAATPATERLEHDAAGDGLESPTGGPRNDLRYGSDRLMSPSGWITARGAPPTRGPDGDAESSHSPAAAGAAHRHVGAAEAATNRGDCLAADDEDAAVLQARGGVTGARGRKRRAGFERAGGRVPDFGDRNVVHEVHVVTDDAATGDEDAAVSQHGRRGVGALVGEQSGGAESQGLWIQTSADPRTWTPRMLTA